MANLLQSLRRRNGEPERSAWPTGTIDDWAAMWGSFGFQGLDYPFIQQGVLSTQTLGGRVEEIGADFRGYIEGAYKSNGVVFACMLVRMLVFSEARFQFRKMRNGRPGDLFGTSELSLLEKPWPNATTGDLLARAMQDADLAGNFYAARRPGPRIKRMRPDWVTIIMGSDTRPAQDATVNDLDVEILGYAYHPGGPQAGNDPTVILADEVAHFAPIPDPSASYRGMSWLTPIIREVMADGAAMSHKLQYFTNGATPNMVVTFDPQVTQKQAEAVKQAIDAKAGNAVGRAYETMVLGGGANVQVVGSDLKQVDFKVTQGHGETRVAAAAAVPPIIVGLSEGLDAATYSNYGQAKRRFADMTMRPLWRNFAGSMASIVKVPANAELWYDDRDVPALREDMADVANIQQTQAVSIRQLVDAGFSPDSVIEAIKNEDWSQLDHSGLFSVQLHPKSTVPGGNVLQGEPVPTGNEDNANSDAAPAQDGQNGRRMLERFVGGRE